MLITSVNNPLIKTFTNLLDKKNRDIEGKFLVEGYHLVEEAYKKKLLLEAIILEKNDFNFDIEKVFVSENVMRKLSKLTTIPKIIGVCKMPDKNEILGDKILILDGIQDPGNMGTIIRSSVAFSIDTIILSRECVDIYNDKVIRGSQGNIFNINIIRDDLINVIDELKKRKFTIYGSVVNNAKAINEIAFNNKFAIIMGNEGNGISEEILKLCDESFTIKTNRNVESLNVAVACSIILYEIGGK